MRPPNIEMPHCHALQHGGRQLEMCLFFMWQINYINRKEYSNLLQLQYNQTETRVEDQDTKQECQVIEIQGKLTLIEESEAICPSKIRVPSTNRTKCG